MRWFKIEKFFQGGSDTYQIRVPSEVRLTKEDWDAIMEWVGDNTNGGHSYGYRLHRTRLRQQSKKIKVLRYPSDVCSKLMGYGIAVTETRRYI